MMALSQVGRRDTWKVGVLEKEREAVLLTVLEAVRELEVVAEAVRLALLVRVPEGLLDAVEEGEGLLDAVEEGEGLLDAVEEGVGPEEPVLDLLKEAVAVTDALGVALWAACVLLSVTVLL